MLDGSAPEGIPSGLVAVPAHGLASLLMLVLSMGLGGRRIRGCRGSLSDHLAIARRARRGYAAAASRASGTVDISSAAQTPAAEPEATSSPSRTPSNDAASPMAQMPGTDVR